MTSRCQCCSSCKAILLRLLPPSLLRFPSLSLPLVSAFSPVMSPSCPPICSYFVSLSFLPSSTLSPHFLIFFSSLGLSINSRPPPSFHTSLSSPSSSTFHCSPPVLPLHSYSQILPPLTFSTCPLLSSVFSCHLLSSISFCSTCLVPLVCLLLFIYITPVSPFLPLQFSGGGLSSFISC